MWMSPNGNFVYVGAGPGQIWDYQIDQTTGALTLVQKYNIGPGEYIYPLGNVPPQFCAGQQSILWARSAGDCDIKTHQRLSRLDSLF
jgi:hypothetical protein